jgi:hypothetical protein
MLALFVRIILFRCEINGSSKGRALDSSKHNSGNEILLKVRTYHALQNMSLTTDIRFEANTVNEQLPGEYY